MRDNVKHLMKLTAEVAELPSPVIEVGSLQIEGQEAYADMRPFFGECPYLGLDMRPGPGVQCLGDAHRLPFRDNSAGTVLLLDTLEHVLNPTLTVHEAFRVVRQGGIVVLTSHMNFPIHSYPSDYWRFTPAAFDYLLQPFNTRFVIFQGDAEFPHMVAGFGAKAPADSKPTLPGAVAELQTRWPESVSGGPLLLWEPSHIVLGQRVADRHLVELAAGRVVAQSFVCPANHLSRIDVRIAKPETAAFSHVLFRLLEDGPDGREVAAYRLFAPHVIDGGWTLVSVPPQADSAGRRYVLTIESPDAIEGQGLSPWASESTAYAEGRLTIDGQAVEGSLAFQVYCQSQENASPVLDLNAVPPTLSGADGVTALQRLEQERWRQVRYIASVTEAGLDRLRGELRQTEQKIAELTYLQQQALEQSTEAAALSRGLRRSPVYRLWQRISGSLRR